MADKRFEKPEMGIIELPLEDIITTSQQDESICLTDDGGGVGWEEEEGW